MNIFYRPQYQSDITLLIKQLKAIKPALEGEQRRGMMLLWDKEVDREAWKGYRLAQVAQKPYVYQTDHNG